jgi:cell division protein FtsL
VHEIEKLSEARQELEAEYTETKEKLTDLSLESKVLRKAKELGLTAPTERADKIVVGE